MSKERLIEALETALAELRRPTITFTPPKREPLSDEEIIAKYKTISVENALYVPTYYAGFRDAEKAHGIGVDNE